MKRTESDLSEPRDEALYAEFKRIAGDNPHMRFNEVIKSLLESPQPRMWVSFYGVYRTLLRIVHGSREPWKNHSRSTLEQEVERKYYEIRERRAFRGTSLFFMASFIIGMPSKGFFITDYRAKRIIWAMRARKKAERWASRNTTQR